MYLLDNYFCFPESITEVMAIKIILKNEIVRTHLIQVNCLIKSFLWTVENQRYRLAKKHRQKAILLITDKAFFHNGQLIGE